MCPTEDIPNINTIGRHYRHRPSLSLTFSLPVDDSMEDGGVEEGFAEWRGRRIRRDVGSWPCDTIELEVGLPDFSLLFPFWRVPVRSRN
jgi:hypothetical protein